ncbi:MAG: GAF domain-containing protein, partial [Actinobacteria bacterium]
ESLLAVPLRYGTRVVGVIVVSKLGLNQFDEDDVRLLEVLAGHAAVAVENASLYESARRQAESATSLLEFGRELATLVDLDDIAGRVTILSAEILGSRHTSFYLEADGDLRLRAEHGHSPELAAELAARPYPRAALDVSRDPYIAEPQDYEPVIGEAPVPGGRYAVAPFGVDGRVGCLVALVERDDFGEARDRERLELRGARADVRVHRRGARERARGERRVHLDPRALDQGSLPARGPGARPRRARAEAPRARRAPPRHREDRHP